MNIQDIMSKPVITCKATDSLDMVAQLMWKNDCGAIAVISDSGRALGMITDRDICMAAYTQGSALHTIRVSNAMAGELFACHPNDSIGVVERLMSDKQVRRLPVVDADHRPIGMVSLNDIARHTISAWGKEPLEHSFVLTFAAICEPRPLVLARPRPQPLQQLSDVMS